MAKKQSGTAAEDRFAEKLMTIEKIVISRTLQHVEGNTQIIRGGPVEEIQKLKQQPVKNISVDSVSLLPELINAGLIDEFNMVVHPVMAGSGRPLLPAGSLQTFLDLELADMQKFKSGCVAFRYLKK